MLQPFLDPAFDPRSLGFRPGCSREQALAHVEHLARETNELAWIATDVQDAFTRVLHGRLRDVLQWHGLDEPMMYLIERIITNGTKRGISQGGSLSPLMLNTYLDIFVDRIWRGRWPNVPLVRVADDLLLLCRTFGEAQNVYRDLQDLLRAVGMNLKGTAQSSIRLLGDGMYVDWLGYCLRWNGTRLEARIAERGWERFRENLQDTYLDIHPQLRASESILGWVDQLGPCFESEPTSVTYEKVQQIACEEGFEEIPTECEFARTWERAALRCRATWHALQLQRIGERNPEQHVNQSQRVSHQASAGRSIDAFLYTDGSCCPRTRIGGWAFVLEGPIIGRQVLDAGSSPRTTNNVMELTAVIRGLQAVPEPCRVHIVVDSEYVRGGIADYLPRWRQNGWRRGTRRRLRPLRNLAIWQTLDRAMERHHVSIERVPGHAGHPENELADQLARQAAENLIDAGP